MTPTGLWTTLFIFLLSNVSGVARVVAAIGGYMTLTMGLLFADSLGWAFGMKDAAVLIVAFDLGSLITAWNLRKHISLSFMLVVGVPWTIFDLLGTKVLIGNDQAGWLKQAFGVLLFLVLATDAFAAWKNAKQAPSATPAPACVGVKSNELQGSANTETQVSCNASAPTSPASKPIAAAPPFDCLEQWRWCLFLGVTGGLLKGLFTVPMPVLVLFVLFSGIDRDTWRANIIVMSIAGVFPKGYYLFYVNQEMEWAKIPLFVATIVGVVAANPIGNFIATRVDKEQFKDIVRLFAFVGGSFMIVSGEAWQMPVSFAALLLGLLLMCLRWRRRPSDAPADPGEAAQLRQDDEENDPHHHAALEEVAEDAKV